MFVNFTMTNWNTCLHSGLVFLENNVRKPLEGSKFDKCIATPCKNLYIKHRKMD